MALNGTAVIGDIQRILEPWKKEVDFVYNIATPGSTREETLKSLDAALKQWNL